MLQRSLCLPFLAVLFFAALGSYAQAQTAAPVLSIDGLGKGAAPVNGPWQFHLGDNAAWAAPQTVDNDRSAGWEQIRTDKPWGEQGHPAYTGYAWYRKHVHLTMAPGAPADVAMLIERVENVYEIYWNGVLVGHHGQMPPNPTF